MVRDTKIFNKAKQKHTTLAELLEEPISVVAASLQGYFETELSNCPTAVEVANMTEVLVKALEASHDEGYDAGHADALA